jgi:hypothetical protein
MVKFVKENAPEIFATWEKLKASRPDEAERFFRNVLERLMHLRPMKEHDPDRFELELKAFRADSKCLELAESARQTQDQAKKEEAKANLRKAVEELFDLRQQTRKKELEELRKRVAELESDISRRQEKRGEMIDRRLAQLLGERDEMEW